MADNHDTLNIQPSKETSFKIVKMYYERPMLWNPRDQFYRVTSLKLQAWQEMADEFGLDVTNMRKKMNSLLASHRRETARIRNGKRSNWYLYDAMKYMPNHIPNDPSLVHDTMDNTDNTETEFVNEDDEDSNYDEVAEIQYEQEDSDLVKYFNVPPQEIIVKEEDGVQVPPKQKKLRTIYVRPEKPQPKTKFVPVPMEMTESYTEDIVNPIENIVYENSNNDKDGKDECDVFGEYIAKSLRKHNDKTRAMIKQAINNIIYKEEMRKYDTDSHVGSSRNN